MKVNEEWLARAEEIVGKDGVLSDPADLAPYGRDEFSLEDYARQPAAVVRPSTEEQVAAVVRLCARTGVPLTARGGGTGLAAACVPAPGGIVLSMERLNRVLDADAANRTLTVQAGVTLGAVYREAEAIGLSFPPHPGDESAQVGGAVATNAGGARAVKYGTIKRFVLGLQVVAADGETVELGGKLLKSSTGYHLMELMIGSEGTLGVITRVTLALLPRAASVQTLVAPFETVEAAIGSVPAVLATGIVPFAVEFVEHTALRCGERLLQKSWPTHEGQASLLILLDGASEEEVLGLAERIGGVLEEQGALDVLIADQRERQQEIMEIRSLLYEALRPGMGEIFDICLPPAEVAGHVKFVHELEARAGAPLPTFGHAADGNVHTHFMRTRLEDGLLGEEIPGWREKLGLVREELYADAIRRHGVISGEHGIGLVKREHLERNVGPAALRLMRAVKAALDPQGILNPGKVLPD